MRCKIFSERTGLKVSELALGTGMFGQAWGYGATPEEVWRIIAGFADAGGNFIDINPAGIFIQGTLVMINSGGAPGSLPAASPEAPDSVQDAKEAKPTVPNSADDSKSGQKSAPS